MQIHLLASGGTEASDKAAIIYIYIYIYQLEQVAHGESADHQNELATVERQGAAGGFRGRASWTDSTSRYL